MTETKTIEDLETIAAIEAGRQFVAKYRAEVPALMRADGKATAAEIDWMQSGELPDHWANEHLLASIGYLIGVRGNGAVVGRMTQLQIDYNVAQSTSFLTSVMLTAGMNSAGVLDEPEAE